MGRTGRWRPARGPTLGWPGSPNLLPALLAAVQRLLAPGLEDRACSLAGALILELLRHAWAQMVRLLLGVPVGGALLLLLLLAHGALHPFLSCR